MTIPLGSRNLLRYPQNSIKGNTRSKRPTFALVILTVLTILLVTSYFHPTTVFATSVKMTTHQPVFSLLVTLTFSSDEHKQTFLRDIKPVAEHVRREEPRTLAYEVLLSDKDPLQVLMLERYTDKEEAYLQIHKSSKPFLEFRSKLQKMQQDGHVSIDGNSYLDAGIGFGDRVSS